MDGAEERRTHCIQRQLSIRERCAATPLNASMRVELPSINLTRLRNEKDENDKDYLSSTYCLLLML